MTVTGSKCITAHYGVVEIGHYISKEVSVLSKGSRTIALGFRPRLSGGAMEPGERLREALDSN